MNLKRYWEILEISNKTRLLIEHHFWGGLRDFPYKWIPEDLKRTLRDEIKENDAKNAKTRK